MNLLSVNYDQYMERMTNSAEKTTKGLIPEFAIGRVLDVGCGSGVLLKQIPNAKGIDLNPDAIDFCKKQNLNVECVSLHDVKGTFDTIIFSSVLHEFSSYAEEYRYSRIPIENALKDAFDHLEIGGRIIIRDGASMSDDPITVIAKNYDVVKAVLKYKKENPVYTNVNVWTSGKYITAPGNFLKEFMFTYTWGPESYPREVQEKYGILSTQSWKEVVKHCGFKIELSRSQPEEYVEYLSKYFRNNKQLKAIFQHATVFIVATKKDLAEEERNIQFYTNLRKQYGKNFEEIARKQILSNIAADFKQITQK